MEFNHEYFNGKTAVVTGAASGIGYGLCQALLQAGAMVTMADWNEALLAESADRLKAYECKLHTSRVDVSKQEEVQALIQDAASRYGKLDFLFNNAGIGWGAPIGTATLEMWRRVIGINLWGAIYGIDAVLPIMSRQKSGHIVNTSSIFGLIPGVYESLYCTTKHAVAGLSEALRYELAPDGIYVSVVCPGAVATRIFPEGTLPPHALSPEEAAAIILNGVVRHDGIILVGEDAVTLWRDFRSSSEAFDNFIQDRTLGHRRYYSEKAKVE